MRSRSWLPILLVTIVLVACGQDTPDVPDAEPTAVMTTDKVPTEPTAVMTTDKLPAAPTAVPTNVAKDVSDTTLATATPAPRIVVEEGSPQGEATGVVSIEELYLEADLIVRVELLGTTVATSTPLLTRPDGSQRTGWCVSLDFRLRAIEYLTGSGSGEITAAAGRCRDQEWFEGVA